MTNIVLQDDPDIVLIQDTAAPTTIQTGIVLVGSSGSITGPGVQAVSGNVPQWANNQGSALGPGLGVGTNPSNLVQLDSAARLPAVDGSQLTNMPKTTFAFAALVGGRLSLATGTPFMGSSASGASTIYWTAYSGECAPVTFDGATWTFVDIGGELSQALSDTTKSPAAAAASSIYDMFLWWDSASSVYRCTRGPAWASSTSRGYSLTRMRGLLVNAAAITNGPAANFGLWVGTIATNASGTVDFIYGGSGVGANFGVWNNFNRVSIATLVQTSTSSWSYASTSPRVAGGITAYSVTWVQGAREDIVYAAYQVLCEMVIPTNGASDSLEGYALIGLDGSIAYSTIGFAVDPFQGSSSGPGATWYTTMRTEGAISASIGLHSIQAMEETNGGTVTYFGGNDGGLIATVETLITKQQLTAPPRRDVTRTI